MPIKNKIFDKEAEEIISRYNRRSAKDNSNIYNMATPSCYLSSLEKQEYTLKILAKIFGCNFTSKKYLEVGCGTGTNLCTLLSWGVPAENLYGNDIFQPSLDKCKKRLPSSVKLQAGNFLDCKYEEKFDVILFSTVLSSILDIEFQQECMKYAYNLLQEGGIILLYDFVFDNPRNKDVKGVSLKTLANSAPWRNIKFNSVTLAPPIARRLEKLPILIKVLRSLKILNTHKIGYLMK